MVNLSCRRHPTARLLDLVPGRSGTVYKAWITARGPIFRDGVRVATLGPSQGYKNAIDDQLEGATCVLDAFHVVKLATSAVDEVRRRIQPQTLGQRGPNGDPLYDIRNLLRAGRERLTERQQDRLQTAFTAHDEHISVEIAYQCGQDGGDMFHQPTLAQGRRLATRVIEALQTCPTPETARLGRTLR